MRRRDFIILMGDAAASLPFAAHAQESGRIYRLAFMTGAPRAASRNLAFFDELKVLGFVEGQNLKVVAAGFDVRNEQFGEVAATLAKAAPDACFCVGDAAAHAASESLHSVPIVALSGDLVAAGLVRSLARPGGNMTGISVFGRDLNGKRQDILLEAVPATRRMAALADPTAVNAAELEVLQNAARARGVELAVFSTRAPEQIPPRRVGVEGDLAPYPRHACAVLDWYVLRQIAPPQPIRAQGMRVLAGVDRKPRHRRMKGRASARLSTAGGRRPAALLSEGRARADCSQLGAFSTPAGRHRTQTQTLIHRDLTNLLRSRCAAH